MRNIRQESVIINKGGKGEAVRRRNPETKDIENICECWYNADFSRGCIAQVHVDLLQEVLDNNGVYATMENFDRYKKQGLINQRCNYCYAFRNTGNVLPREVNEKTRASFIEHNPKYVRIGKLTEAGHPYYFEELMKFFSMCQEYGTQIIFPTKMFPFGIEGALETKNFSYQNNPVVAKLSKKINMPSGKEISRELNKTGGSLMYSIGYDKEEHGPALQGFTNEWRIKQAIKYFINNVNVSLTVVCDVTQSIKENTKKGSLIEDALFANKTIGLNLRILPLRPNSREIAGRLCSGSWGDIVYRNHTQVLSGIEGFFDFPVVDGIEQRPYKRRGNNDIIPRIFHPDFKRLYNRGVGFCGIVEGYEHCDKCNLSQERIEFKEEELVQIDYSKKSKKQFKPKKINKKDDQGKLF